MVREQSRAPLQLFDVVHQIMPLVYDLRILQDRAALQLLGLCAHALLLQFLQSLERNPYFLQHSCVDIKHMIEKPLRHRDLLEQHL